MCIVGCSSVESEELYRGELIFDECTPLMARIIHYINFLVYFDFFLA